MFSANLIRKSIRANLKSVWFRVRNGSDSILTLIPPQFPIEIDYYGSSSWTNIYRNFRVLLTKSKPVELDEHKWEFTIFNASQLFLKVDFQEFSS